MRINHHTATLNVAHHAAIANSAVLCGHSADRIVTALKRLGRKRQSTPASYGSVTGSPGMSMPGRGQGRPMSGDQRPILHTTFPEAGTRRLTAGGMPAPVWATLVITRALSS
jgi:hypothetical protein